MDFYYDEGGKLFDFSYNGIPYYTKNLQSDIIRILDRDGSQVVSYVYDSWGKLISTSGSLAETVGVQNPFRYRGYYYDVESEMYYLNSRYYDPEIGRFINADILAGIVGQFGTHNVFAYCQNNPINMCDENGHFMGPPAPPWAVDNSIVGPVLPYGYIQFSQKSHEDNRRPNTGTPGSTWKAPNGDKRTFGPDGRPKQDYDHDDHGFPESHPHDENGGHYHDWDWSKNPPRGKAYVIKPNPVAGVVLVTLCVIGIVIVAADAIGVGVADNFLFEPLGVGIGEGLIMISG